MTADNRVTVARPEDILGFIPHALGLWPKESLVAITLRGQILGATLRVDLPADTSESGLAAYSRSIGEYLDVDHEADGVLLAIFSEDGWEDGGVIRQNRPVLKALDLSLAARGLALRDAWLIGADFWRSAFCNDEQCCPEPGRPVDQIRDSRLNAEMVFLGSSVRASPRLLGPGDEPADDPAFRRSEDAMLEHMMRLWQSEKAFDELLDVWTHVVDSGVPDALDAQAAAFLRASLRVPAWRDAVVVLAAAGRSAARGGAEAFRFFRREGEGEENLAVPTGLRHSTLRHSTQAAGSAACVAGPSQGSRGVEERRRPAAGDIDAGDIDALRYGDVLLGHYPENPLWDRLAALDMVLAMLSKRGGGEARAAALTIRGWIQWCKGSGSFAVDLLSQADAEHPGYRLAELLNEVVRRGKLCGWAKTRASAWPKFGGAVA